MLSEPSHITFPTGEEGSDEAYALCYPPQSCHRRFDRS